MGETGAQEKNIENQVNSSRNWVTIIRSFTLKPKTNKKNKMLTFQTLDIGTCSHDFLFHQKSIQQRFVLK